MTIDIIGDEVFLKASSNESLYELLNGLNTQYIPYKSYCGTMIVMTYATWLRANVKEHY